MPRVRTVSHSRIVTMSPPVENGQQSQCGAVMSLPCCRHWAYILTPRNRRFLELREDFPVEKFKSDAPISPIS